MTVEMHLVPAKSAAGSLRGELRSRSQVLAIEDWLAIGPLDDGPKRSAFTREMWGPVDADLVEDDMFQVWTGFSNELARKKPERLLIWSSQSAAEIIFLRMAINRLRASGVDLWHVPVPSINDTYSTSSYPGHQLMQMRALAQRIAPERQDMLAAEFSEIAANPAPVRVARSDGTLSFHPIDYYDDALIAACPSDWTRAARVVADVMMSDDRNVVPDLPLAWRLRTLVDTARIEARGDPGASIRDFQVRRARK